MLNERMQKRAERLLISVSDRLENAGDPALKIQLEKIAEELKSVITDPDYVPYYQKVIVDSCAQDDELGNDLLCFASDLDKRRRL